MPDTHNAATATTRRLVACPHCDTLNRIPRDRPAERGKCGSCHGKLFTGEVLPLDAARFARHAAGDLPLLVDFWAAWCGPCKMMAPVFAATAQRLEPRLRFAKVDTESVPELAARFAIRSIPTMILFEGGREKARLSGAVGAGELERWIAQQLPV